MANQEQECAALVVGGSIRPIRSKGTVLAAMGSHYPGRLQSGLGDDLASVVIIVLVVMSQCHDAI